MKRALGIGTLIAMLLLLGQGSASAKGHARLIVDDDRVQCPAAGYTTIQAALLAAQNGDTIVVCPGTYSGAVTVAKTVNLQGGHTDDSDRRCLSGTVDANAEPLIGGQVTVTANGAELRGLTFQGAGAGVILGATARLAENCFRANGTAITVTSSGHGSIEHNQFTGQSTAAIKLAAATRIVIEHNVLVGSAAIRLAGASDNVISHNSSTGAAKAAILLDAGSMRNTISHNELDGGPSALGLHTNGIRFDGGPISGNIVEHNSVTGFGKTGIRLKGGATGNTFSSNRVDRNGLLDDENGFELSVGATGNLFLNNLMHGNANLDAQDKNVQAANTWTHNRCDTSDPTWICAERDQGAEAQDED